MPLYACGPDGQPLTYPATVWKYELEITDTQTLQVPLGTKPLSAQYQGDALVLWVLCSPHAPRGDVTVHILDTGHHVEVSPRWQYIGTAQDPGFPLTWHVFYDGVN